MILIIINVKGKKMLTNFRLKRYYFYILITIISLLLPWIKINGNQIFLLSFDEKKLHLMGVVFDMQELYLMPFLLMLLFIGIFGLTTALGRAWCGWSCPQTIFRVIYRDLIETKILKLRKRIQNKQKEPDYSKIENKIKKIVGIFIWSLLAFVAASNFMWYFIPPEIYFQYLLNPIDNPITIGFVISLTLFLIYDVVFLQEKFCIYVCPYARVQSILFDEQTITPIYDKKRGGEIYNEKKEKQIFNLKELSKEEECTTCEKCVTVCPTHIDIRKGMQLECINCLECVDACSSVMTKLNKPSLVEWNSKQEIETKKKTNYFRKSILAYIGTISLILLILILMASKKEYMLLNINKGNEVYSIKKDSVDNSYIIFLQNTDNKKHTYKIEISNKDIKIVRPKKEIKLKAGEKRKEILILRTKKDLSKFQSKDTILQIKIISYAIDNKEKIKVERKAIFIHPNSKILEEKRKNN